MAFSRLLHNFKTGLNHNLKLCEIADHVVEFSYDNVGSIFIKTSLIRATSTDKAMVLNEILRNNSIDLAMHKIGNDVIQAFLKFGECQQQKMLLESFSADILSLTQHKYGSRVVEKGLEAVPSLMQKMIEDKLGRHVVACARNKYGSCVLQRYIELMDPLHLQFIFESVKNQIVKLSTDRYGNYVIRCLLTKLTDVRVEIALQLGGHAFECMMNEHGTYVIQKCIECIDPPNIKFIFDACEDQVLRLSKDMRGCHVIASLLEKPCDDQIKIGKELLQHVSHCVKDQYGSIVIEKALQALPSDLQSDIADILVDIVPECVTDQFGSKVTEKTLEQMADKHGKQIIEKMEPKMNEYVRDKYGSFVVQKCVECLHASDINVILDVCTKEFSPLSMDCHGRHVIQSTLQHCIRIEEQAVCTPLYVSFDLEDLMKDKNGSFVIRQILVSCDTELKQTILRHIIEEFLRLSRDEFACHVAAEAIAQCHPQDLLTIMQTLRENIRGLIRDKCGHYVVQKCITHGDQESKTYITQWIMATMEKLITCKYGHEVLQECMYYEWNLRTQLVICLSRMKGDDFYKLLKNVFARNVLNKLIVLDGTLREELLPMLCPYVFELVKSDNGTQILANLYTLLESDVDKVHVTPVQ